LGEDTSFIRLRDKEVWGKRKRNVAPGGCTYLFFLTIKIFEKVYRARLFPQPILSLRLIFIIKQGEETICHMAPIGKVKRFL
jgi:hypothetical protein